MVRTEYVIMDRYQKIVGVFSTKEEAEEFLNEVDPLDTMDVTIVKMSPSS